MKLGMDRQAVRFGVWTLTTTSLWQFGPATVFAKTCVKL